MAILERVTTKKGYRYLAGVGFLALMGLVGHFDYKDQMATQAAIESEREAKEIFQALTEKEARLAEFFAKQGSPAAVEMSKAVAKRKRPRLLAAVAAVESNGDPAAVGLVGEVTAWQIREILWGSTGNSIDDHSRKAEDILESLIKQHNGNLRKALSAYNGDRSGRYAAKVMRKVAEVRI